MAIPIRQGFRVSAQELIDDRLVVGGAQSRHAQRVDIDVFDLTPGLLVFDLNDDQLYIYNPASFDPNVPTNVAADWSIIQQGGGGGGGGGTGIIPSGFDFPAGATAGDLFELQEPTQIEFDSATALTTFNSVDYHSARGVSGNLFIATPSSVTVNETESGALGNVNGEENVTLWIDEGAGFVPLTDTANTTGIERIQFATADNSVLNISATGVGTNVGFPTFTGAGGVFVVTINGPATGTQAGRLNAVAAATDTVNNISYLTETQLRVYVGEVPSIANFTTTPPDRYRFDGTNWQRVIYADDLPNDLHTRFIDEIVTLNHQGFLKSNTVLDVGFTTPTSPAVDVNETYLIRITGPQGAGTGPVETSTFQFSGAAITRTTTSQNFGEWRIDHTHSSWTTLSGPNIGSHSNGSGVLSRTVNELGPEEELDYLVAGRNIDFVDDNGVLEINADVFANQDDDITAAHLDSITVGDTQVRTRLRGSFDSGEGYAFGDVVITPQRNLFRVIAPAGVAEVGSVTDVPVTSLEYVRLASDTTNSYLQVRVPTAITPSLFQWTASYDISGTTFTVTFDGADAVDASGVATGQNITEWFISFADLTGTTGVTNFALVNNLINAQLTRGIGTPNLDPELDSTNWEEVSRSLVFGTGRDEVATWAEGNNTDLIPSSKLPSDIDLDQFVAIAVPGDQGLFIKNPRATGTSPGILDITFTPTTAPSFTVADMYEVQLTAPRVAAGNAPITGTFRFTGAAITAQNNIPNGSGWRVDYTDASWEATTSVTIDDLADSVVGGIGGVRTLNYIRMISAYTQLGPGEGTSVENNAGVARINLEFGTGDNEIATWAEGNNTDEVPQSKLPANHSGILIAGSNPSFNNVTLTTVDPGESTYVIQFASLSDRNDFLRATTGGIVEARPGHSIDLTFDGNLATTLAGHTVIGPTVGPGSGTANEVFMTIYRGGFDPFQTAWGSPSTGDSGTLSVGHEGVATELVGGTNTTISLLGDTATINVTSAGGTRGIVVEGSMENFRVISFTDNTETFGGMPLFPDSIDVTVAATGSVGSQTDVEAAFRALGGIIIPGFRPSFTLHSDVVLLFGTTSVTLPAGTSIVISDQTAFPGEMAWNFPTGGRATFRTALGTETFPLTVGLPHSQRIVAVEDTPNETSWEVDSEGVASVRVAERLRGEERKADVQFDVTGTRTNVATPGANEHSSIEITPTLINNLGATDLEFSVDGISSSLPPLFTGDLLANTPAPSQLAPGNATITIRLFVGNNQLYTFDQTFPIAMTDTVERIAATALRLLAIDSETNGSTTPTTININGLTGATFIFGAEDAGGNTGSSSAAITETNFDDFTFSVALPVGAPAVPLDTFGDTSSIGIAGTNNQGNAAGARVVTTTSASFVADNVLNFSYDPDAIPGTVITTAPITAMDIPAVNVTPVQIATFISDSIGTAFAADGVTSSVDTTHANPIVVVNLGTTTPIDSTFSLARAVGAQPVLGTDYNFFNVIGDEPTSTITVTYPDGMNLFNLTSSVPINTVNNRDDVGAAVVLMFNSLSPEYGREPADFFTGTSQPLGWSADYDGLGGGILRIEADVSANIDADWQITVNNNGADPTHIGNVDIDRDEFQNGLYNITPEVTTTNLYFSGDIARPQTTPFIEADYVKTLWDGSQYVSATSSTVGGTNTRVTKRIIAGNQTTIETWFGFYYNNRLEIWTTNNQAMGTQLLVQNYIGI